jgi:uncharacterized membrane protein YhhN
VYLVLLFLEWEVDTFLKPLLIPLLILFILLDRPQQFLPLIVGALVFSTLGDVFLLSDAELFFMLGLGSFFIAHILYSWIFSAVLRREFAFKVNLWPLSIILTYLIVFLGYLWASLGELLIPVVAYAFIISTMLFLAWTWHLSAQKKSTFIILMGALLFVVSDSLLAISLFKSSFYMDHFWVMLTYLAAQFLLIHGLWSRYRLT